MRSKQRKCRARENFSNRKQRISISRPAKERVTEKKRVDGVTFEIIKNDKKARTQQRSGGIQPTNFPLFIYPTWSSELTVEFDSTSFACKEFCYLVNIFVSPTQAVASPGKVAPFSHFGKITVE